jgi:beta-mannosidase
MVTEIIGSRLEFCLDKQVWYMKQMNPGQGVMEGLPDIPAERDICFVGWNAARIPGDVYSDLQRAGIIDDPYVGRNLVRLTWVQYYEWWYVCRFNAPKEFEELDLQLVLEGVDYSCEVWVNGHYLGKHEGMFSPIQFDVTGLINTYLDLNNSSECDNLLMVKLDPAPQSLYNIAGMHHTFSGDYLPGFVPVGIWRSVKIIGTENARIDDVRIESKLHEDRATISAQAIIELKRGQYAAYDMSISIWDDDSEVSIEKKVMLHPGSNEVEFEIDIANPKIWWPWDMGDQPLYFATLRVSQNGKELDKSTTRFGIREVRMEMNPGITEDEAEFPWTFVINGKPMFLRSGCWGGPPSFFYGRNSYQKYEHFLQLAKECNLNNLRIFGWHPPEVPDFYNLCDELGITVWTNFALASQVLRDDPSYVNAVLSECAEIVKERRNHPANIFWMGGEEVYFSEAQVRSHNKRMMQQIGKHIANYTNIPYADASMMSSPPAIRMGYKPKESIHANGHYYAAGRTLMEDYFLNVDSSIVPELTAASAPCVESLKRFIPKEDLWPMGPTWGYLMANIDILKALNVEVFGDECMDDLETFATSTQIAQGEIFQFALEAIRRKKPRISGVAICHFITNRPLIKWEIVDYYGLPKKSYYYVQKAFQPLLGSLHYTKRRWLPNETFEGNLWIINDYYKEYKQIECRVEMFDADKRSLKAQSEWLDVAENSSARYFDFSCQVKGELGSHFYIEILLMHHGEILSSNEYKLLIDDQEEAKKRGLEYYQFHRQRTLKWGKSLYRDFEECMELD